MTRIASKKLNKKKTNKNLRQLILQIRIKVQQENLYIFYFVKKCIYTIMYLLY